jgi:1-acyl-sn-glycerol-3-phosphate acyltransferase
MINLLILLSVLLVFVEYDIVLRIGRVINREAPVEYSEYILGRALERIFALIRTYRRFVLRFEDHIVDRWPERFILVSNHQSLVDIPVLGYLLRSRRIRFVAKKELGAGFPLVSQALRMQKHCLVTRHGDPGQAMKALDRFARDCRRTGACPVIFLEGTRSKDGSLGHFHTGGLRRVLAEESIPIVVVALDGGSRIRGIRSILKNLKGAGYRVRVVDVLPAPLTKQDLLVASAKSRELIDATIREWRAEA